MSLEMVLYCAVGNLYHCAMKIYAMRILLYQLSVAQVFCESQGKPRLQIATGT